MKQLILSLPPFPFLTGAISVLQQKGNGPFQFDRRFPVACYGVTIFPSPLRGEGWGEGDKFLIPQIPRCMASGEVHKRTDMKALHMMEVA